MLVCRNCYGVYRTDRLIQDGEGVFYCPSWHCGNIEKKFRSKLCDIDDPLLDIITRFWKAGVNTRASCAGHYWKQKFQPYVVFEFYEDSFADYFEASMNENKPDFVSIETIRLSDDEDSEAGSMTVECEAVYEDDITRKIEMQTTFISHLYSVLEKHLAAREEV